jgi:hypothetical protein
MHRALLALTCFLSLQGNLFADEKIHTNTVAGNLEINGKNTIENNEKTNTNNIIEMCRALRGKSTLSAAASFNTLARMGEEALVVVAATLQTSKVPDADKSDLSYFVGVRCGRPGTLGERLRTRLTRLLPVEPLTASPEVVAALMEAAQSKDGRLSETAIMALGSIGEQARPAVPTLARLLKTSQSSRVPIALALQDLGPVAAAATPQLIDMLALSFNADSLTELVSSPIPASVEALVRIGEATVPHLISRFGSTSDQEFKQRIAIILGKISPSGHSALVSIYNTPNNKPEDRALALVGLGTAGDSALPVLEQLLVQAQGDSQALSEINMVLLRMNTDQAMNVYARHRSVTTKLSEDALMDLFRAVGNNDLQTVRYLVEKGVPVNIQIPDGPTLLMFAAQEGNVDIVKILLRYGAKVNIVIQKQGFNFTALSYARSNGHEEVVSLLRQAGAKE